MTQTLTYPAAKALLTGLAQSLIALLLFMLAGIASAQIDPADLLPVEEAFALDAQVADDQRSVELNWQVAEGYYLYRHAFRFTPANDALSFGEPEISAGIAYEDEFFGAVEVYRGVARVRLPIAALPADGQLDFTVGFQGCADLGVCYPPHRQQISLVSSAGAAVTGPVAVNPANDLLAALDNIGVGELTGRALPLPEEQAFQLELVAMDAGELLARFTSHAGYYLYQHTVEFEILSAPSILVSGLEFPEAVPKTDEFFGDTRVYYDQVEIPVLLARTAGPAQIVSVLARFQGCQEDGICYPPMERVIEVDLPAAERVIERETGASVDIAVASTDEANAGSEVVTETEQGRLASALEGRPLLAMLMFFVAGMLLAFTPCVFPMVPILSGLIAGDAENMTTMRAFRLSIVYVLAMAVVYTAFGVIAALLGQNLQAVFQHPAILTSFALLFVLLSLAMFGFYELQLPSLLQTKLNQLSNRQQGGTLIGAAIMGGLSALVVGPCVAPALMGALIYIGQTGDAVLGGGALFSMALGMGLPLVIWGTSAGKLLPRAGAWMNAVKAVFGVGLLALAIWMMERVLPGGVIMLLWGILMIASGVYLGATTRLDSSAGGWTKLWQALGIVLLVFGVMQMIGAAAGGRDWTRPLESLAGGGTTVTQAELPVFTEVDNLDELQRAVAAASRPVFLDFYADWCVDCIRMERRTFPDPAVAAKLSDFDLLKIDVTDNNAEHQQVLRHFGLIGPPAYLFFSNGEELERFRMFGFMSPEEFQPHLLQVEAAAR
ncbi:MAG: protein-disulfide reductase DsbD [Pseudomonadota bacterium]